MRILVITNTFPSYSETFIANHIHGLALHGHDVTVLAKRGSPQSGTPTPREPGVELLYCSSGDVRFAAFRAFWSTLAFALAHPHRWGRVVRQMLLHRDLAASQAFRRAGELSQRPFDITHAEYGPLGNIALALRACGVQTGPICISLRGSDISSYLARKPRSYDLLAREGDLFLPVCSPFVSRLETLGFPRERIRIYRSAIDVASMCFRERPVQLPDVPMLLGAGRFVEKKGFTYALQIIASLSRCFPRLRLVLVGDGPLRGELMAEAIRLGVGDRVEMPGWLRQERLLSLMNEADVFIGTSVTANSGDIEGIPNVIKEAIAVGLPVAAFAHSGVPDLVEDGKTGFLVPERDVESLARRVELILSRDPVVNGMAARARRRIEAEYSLEGQALVAEQLYRAAAAVYSKGRDR